MLTRRGHQTARQPATVQLRESDCTVAYNFSNAGKLSMSLDFKAPLLPSSTPFSSPDFITTRSRKSLYNGSPSQKSIADQSSVSQHDHSNSSDSTFVCPNGDCGSENCNSATCRARFATGASQVGNTQPQQAAKQPVVDRRSSREPAKGFERRQFGNSHANLSTAAAELAVAIDQYKLEHHRRYITCEEMLMVITKLGYRR